MAAVSVLKCVFIFMKLFVGVQGTSDIRTSIYEKFNIMKTDGCHVEYRKYTISQCAVRSLTNYQPFIYLNGECMMCPGDQVTSLMFGAYMSYFPRSHSIFSQQTSDSVLAEIQLSRPLTPGTMIYLSVTPLDSENYFDFRSDTPQTTVLHFYIRFNWGRIGFNTWTNGVWGTDETYGPPTDPWFAGQRTDMHVLLTLDRFVIYFNRVYFCEYLYRLPLSDVTHILFAGDGVVHELSL